MDHDRRLEIDLGREFFGGYNRPVGGGGGAARRPNPLGLESGAH